MAAINCNTITSTPAPHPPQPRCYTPHDLTTTSLMIRKTDQWKCSQADEIRCWLCTHAQYSPRGHPLVKAWPGGGWRGAALSLSQVSLLLYSLGRVQHCSTAACSLLHPAVTCQHRQHRVWWIAGLAHSYTFLPIIFPFSLIFPFMQLIFHQQEQAGWTLTGLQSCIGCASEYSQHP